MRRCRRHCRGWVRTSASDINEGSEGVAFEWTAEGGCLHLSCGKRYVSTRYSEYNVALARLGEDARASIGLVGWACQQGGKLMVLSDFSTQTRAGSKRSLTVTSTTTPVPPPRHSPEARILWVLTKPHSLPGPQSA